MYFCDLLFDSLNPRRTLRMKKSESSIGPQNIYKYVLIRFYIRRATRKIPFCIRFINRDSSDYSKINFERFDFSESSSYLNLRKWLIQRLWNRNAVDFWQELHNC